ncbi:MAG TPA: DUF3263 domain-containing protein [Acidimicrobiales bacterium]|nr:DUF3263 domain-containing protein [Acidimicrobiales bacterium]
MALSDRERAILDCERTWWLAAGSKETSIRASLGLSTTRYYKLLAGLIETDEAFAYDPLVVLRLRRERDKRRRARFEGRSAGGPPAR